MCDFANELVSDPFVHPVIRAISLHFALAYDHPFVDGNGRVARALFYWCMLRNKYWLCQFISISQVILKAHTQYARAFLYTETDENDLTYFIMHQLRVIKQALDALHEYIAVRLQQRKDTQARLRLAGELNERQLDLVDHALRHPNASYGIRQHQVNCGIVYETARTDLLGLAEKGLMSMRKSGRTLEFRPIPDLDKKLASF